jgi:hypothetical protein
MVNRKKDADKKSKGILLNLKPEPRRQLYEYAKKEKRTVTSILEEALDIYMKNKNVKLNNGFDEFMGGKADGDLFGGSSKNDFDLDKELNVL